jgi:hypothetical protein
MPASAHRIGTTTRTFDRNIRPAEPRYITQMYYFAAIYRGFSRDRNGAQVGVESAPGQARIGASTAATRVQMTLVASLPIWG